MIPVKTFWRWQDMARFDKLDQPGVAFGGDLFTGRGGTLDLRRVSRLFARDATLMEKRVAEDVSLMTQLVLVRWSRNTALCLHMI